MAKFLVLLDYTPQGIGKISDTLSRAQRFGEAAQKAGVTVQSQYWTTGEHDGVLMLEAADEAAVAGLLLKLAGEGNVRTRTLRAFDAAEMKAVLAAAAK